MSRSGIFLAILVASLSARAALPGMDDAGSGADAPDTPQRSYELPRDGAFAGALAPPGDADWYLLPDDLSGLACANVTIDSNAVARATLSTDPSLSTGVWVDIIPGETIVLPIAVPKVEHVLLGFSPNASYASGGLYTFNFSVEKKGPHQAKPSDGCLAGSLDASSEPQDLYAFIGVVDTHLALSMASTSGSHLALIAPSGAVVKSLESGSAETFTLNETGTWKLIESLGQNTTSSDYSVGFSLDGGNPPDPCRPACTFAVR